MGSDCSLSLSNKLRNDNGVTLGKAAGNLKDTIGGERPDIINRLENIATIRNRFMHADSSIGYLSPEEAGDYFQQGTRLCNIMIEDLRRRCLTLSVAICQERIDDFDQAIALWILQEKEGGIGRWHFYDDSNESQVPLYDFKFKIGGVAGEFGRSSGKGDHCIARRMATRFNAEQEYAELVAFAEQKQGSSIIVDSQTPAEALEGIWKIAVEQYGEEPKRFLKWAFELFTLMADNELLPTDPCLFRRFPAESKTKYASLVSKAESRTDDCEYNRLKLRIVQSSKSLSAESYEGRYEYLAEINPKAKSWRIHALPGRHKPNLTPIYRVLQSRGYDPDPLYNELRSKPNGKLLSVRELKEIILEAEKKLLGLK